MVSRFVPICLLLVPLAGAARARNVPVPLDPASLAGAEVFSKAPRLVAEAARDAGLDFVTDPRPLPPQVVLPLDTADGALGKKNGLLIWRGEMLPDQLAPAETGMLIRKRRQPDGAWQTLGSLGNHPRPAETNLVPAVRANAHFTLPATIIETPYELGTIGKNPVLLVLWRMAEEDSLPLGGALVLTDPSPALLAALQARLPPFPAQADWAAEFDALSAPAEPSPSEPEPTTKANKPRPNRATVARDP